MENSENKSLISTGSSNLAKTEKLLSITQKILSEIKPQYESVRIGNQEWMTRNLDVDRFRNGDLVPHVESNEEWKKAGENGQPAWCHYDNDLENGKKYGKLYNWFAVNDPRGLAPEGWRVPTDAEWETLVEYLGGEGLAGDKMKSVKGWEWKLSSINGNGNNSSGFNSLPCGQRDSNGIFEDIIDRVGRFTVFWSATELFKMSAWYRFLENFYSTVQRGFTSKQNGFSVRCVRA